MRKVISDNVHSCIDIHRKNSLKRIAELIREERPAIVGLNEVETNSPRTLFAHQPRRLAAARDMLYAHGPTLKLGPIGFFGNAILSRYPIYETRNIRLPGSREPRCCLRAVLRIPGGLFTVLCTHLGLNRQERTDQILELKRIVEMEKHPVILMGDFNCGTDQLAPLYDVLTDTGRLFGSKPTYPCDAPVARIDYIFVSGGFYCQGLRCPQTDASDHLPVVAELRFHQADNDASTLE